VEVLDLAPVSKAKLSQANFCPYLETNAAIVSLQIKDFYLVILSI